MRFGLFVPNFGAGFCEASALASLAADAERAGWDGFFLWDHVAPGAELQAVDPFVALAAVAAATRTLRIGTLVTPMPRRRPAVLARQTVSLDRLSGGRLVLGVGIGSGRSSEWEDLGEERDPRVRAAMLDEGLEVLQGLWSGEPFSFRGRHYVVSGARFRPVPVQRPRIPVWVAGYWPHRRPLLRAARWDGVFPLFRGARPEEEPALLARAVDAVRAARSDDAAFDVVTCSPPRSEAELGAGSERVAALARAGATWWLERLTPEELGGDWNEAWPRAAFRRRVEAGPPSPR